MGRGVVRATIMVAIAVSVLAGWAASTASARTLHYQITVTVSGPGRVTGTGDGGSFDCSTSCSAMIREKTLLVLTAVPNDGAQFTGWGGSCVQYGSDTTCQLSITGPKDVTAGFGTPPPPPPPRFGLAVRKAGTGTGYVAGAGGIDCGPTCTATFAPGTKVALLAVADDGSAFVGWSGAGCGGTDQCLVTLAADTQVTATFDHVDRDAPHLRTFASAAKPGKTALLRYRVADDSGKSAETFTIMKGKAVVGRVAVPLKRVHYGRTYAASWRVPAKTAKGKLVFCAVAADKAGNASKRSCSGLRIT
jgi:hypothetical protein